jgi:hypothetical protein
VPRNAVHLIGETERLFLEANAIPCLRRETVRVWLCPIGAGLGHLGHTTTGIHLGFNARRARLIPL